MADVKHNCGFVVAHSLHDVYAMIRDLQHRGREATGIMAVGEKIDAIKWAGPVDFIDLDDLHHLFPGDRYHTFAAHVRYATRGRKEKDKLLKDAHPHTIGGNLIDNGSFVVVRDCDYAGVHNGQVDEKYFSDLDGELMQTDCDTERLLHLIREKGLPHFVRTVPMSYTMAVASRDWKDVHVIRDRTGIKPGYLFKKDGRYGAASEDIAFRKNGGDNVEELRPGAIYHLDPNGGYRVEQIVPPELRSCFFEWNYIAHQESHLRGRLVRSIRESLGEQLAAEFSPPDVDVVTYLPRCPKDAARAFASKTGKPFLEDLFLKLRAERAFQGSTPDERAGSIRNNLFLSDEAVKYVYGRVVLVVDDSIVRGNNAKLVKYLLEDVAGVKKVYLASYTPPIGIIGADGEQRGCYWGVDMPPNDAFIARGKTSEEISSVMGMTVRYLSLEGMLKVYEEWGLPRDSLCFFCVGGPRPNQKYVQIEIPSKGT